MTQFQPSGQLIRALEKGLSVVNTHRPAVEYLEELGRVDPGIAEAVERARAKLDHLDKLCTTGLNLANSANQPNA